MKPIDEPRSRMKAAKCRYNHIGSGLGGLRVECYSGKVTGSRSNAGAQPTTFDVCQLCPFWEARTKGPE